METFWKNIQTQTLAFLHGIAGTESYNDNFLTCLQENNLLHLRI